MLARSTVAVAVGLCLSSRRWGTHLVLLPSMHLADPAAWQARLELRGADLIRGPVAVWSDELLSAVLGGETLEVPTAVLRHRDRGEEE